MKNWIKVALFAVVFLAVAAVWFGLHEFNLKHPDTSKVKPDFVVTATALQKEFEDNEKEASSKYIKKIIEVSGTIATVTPADSTHINVSLKTGSDISSVICTFTASGDHPKFLTGEEITLRGECSGFLMDVLLNNCAKVMNQK
jgi:tRNA_anti-like